MPYLTPDSINAIQQTRLLTVSIDDYLRGAVTGALFDLTDADNWEQLGTMTPDECADYFQGVFWDFMASSLIGVIIPYILAACPPYALPCDGTQYSKATNPEYEPLYNLLDSAFIVDADNFIVPDLRDKVVLGAGGARSMNDSGGEEAHTLDISEIPSHSHTDTGHVHTEITATPTPITIGAGVPVPSAVPGVGITGSGSASLTNTGGDGSHNNMQPFLALAYAVIFR